jgi:hypothetical protein
MQKPLCIPFVENSKKNRYWTIRAAIVCGDLNFVLTKMIHENWDTTMRELVCEAWYDHNHSD